MVIYKVRLSLKIMFVNIILLSWILKMVFMKCYLDLTSKQEFFGGINEIVKATSPTKKQLDRKEINKQLKS